MKPQAAAVVIVRGSRILAFQKFDVQGLSLPCGKIEYGESQLQAAIRETKEETGYDVELEDENGVSYAGYDVVGGTIVHSFRCRIVGGDLLTEAQGEGRACWASVRDVADGPFWHYNRRALAAMHINIPLHGKFHSHITADALSIDEMKRAAQLVHGKLTVISLDRDERQQVDCMITHHYVTGHHGLEDQHDVETLLRARGHQLIDAGLTVHRLKLEYDLLHESNDRHDIAHALSSGLYTEIHVKCTVRADRRSALIAVAKQAGWHPSRNVYAVVDGDRIVQFVNRRFYGSTVTLHELDDAVDQLVGIVPLDVSIDEIKHETAVFDTNNAHDRWWVK